MQSKDIIRLFGHSLFVQFGDTGEHRYVNTLNLQKGLTLMKDGCRVQACYHEFLSPINLDVFGSEALADRAFDRMQIVLRRYARYRRFAALGKSIVKWVITPIGVLMLALALNAAATRTPLASLTGQLGNPVLSAPTTLGAVNAAPSLVGPPAVEIAKAMADGVRAGKFSVPLSKSGKDTLLGLTH